MALDDPVHVRLFALLAAGLPAIALFLYIAALDRFRTDMEAMLTSAGAGFVVAFPVAVAERLVDRLVARIDAVIAFAAAEAFVVAALIEESAKLAVLCVISLRRPDVSRPMDVVTLAVCVSLGFGLIENIFYVFGTSDWTRTAAARAVTAVPAHAMFGVVMGCFAVLARRSGKAEGAWWALALAAPMLLHGAYDFPLFLQERMLVTGPPAISLSSAEVSGLWCATMGLIIAAAGTALWYTGATERGAIDTGALPSWWLACRRVLAILLGGLALVSLGWGVFLLTVWANLLEAAAGGDLAVRLLLSRSGMLPGVAAFPLAFGLAAGLLGLSLARRRDS